MTIIKRTINDLKKYNSYAKYAAKAELKSEVASSYLNWLWWILNPLCFMGIYTLVFGYVFNSKEQHFPLFIFLGLAIWDFFNKSVVQSVKLVKNNKGIVLKVYLPKYILLLQKLYSNLFKMGICLVLVFITMLILKIEVSFHILLIFPILLEVFIFTFAIGMILLHFGVFIEDLSNVLNIFLRLLFYVTGIFYNTQTRLPEPYSSIISKLNPLAVFINSLRDICLYNKLPNIKILIVWGIFSGIFLVIALKVIYKYENSYVKSI